jgi:hypothetical protein
MKARLLVCLMLFSLLGCYFIPIARNWPLSNQQFSVGNGAFIFRDVVLNGTTLPGSWNIKGFVRNSTEQDWRRIQFDIQLYDQNGNALKDYIDRDITFTEYLFTKRGENPFTTNYFKFLPRPNPIRAISYEITYKGSQSGKEIFVMVKPSESRELMFEDQAIRIRFTLSETQIGLLLQNKMTSPIKIDWNTVSYVDITGLAHSVMHTGVRYIERDRPQVATIIPPEAMIEDAIVPSDHISYTPGSGGGWSSRPLFPALAETDLYIGKTFSVFMPLELEGSVKNYSFTFRIERETASVQ